MFATISSWVSDLFFHIFHFWEMNTLNAFLYYVPAFLCLVFYFGKSVLEFKKDFDARAGGRIKTLDPKKANSYDRQVALDYVPHITYGTLLGRFVLSLLPVANLWLTVTEVMWTYITNIMEFFQEFFNKPIVPDTAEHAAVRGKLLADKITSA